MCLSNHCWLGLANLFRNRHLRVWSMPGSCAHCPRLKTEAEEAARFMLHSWQLSKSESCSCCTPCSSLNGQGEPWRVCIRFVILFMMCLRRRWKDRSALVGGPVLPSGSTPFGRSFFKDSPDHDRAIFAWQLLCKTALKNVPSQTRMCRSFECADPKACSV